MRIKCKVEILSKKTISELPTAWNKQDYINILDLCGFADMVDDAELKEMCMMALADQEPAESAQLLLKYRLDDALNEGQIDQLSHEMQEDKLSEEYPDIHLHEELFNVNQLLFKSFNGKFPNAKAIVIQLNIKVEPINSLQEAEDVSEIIIKALVPALGSHSVIARLYGEQIEGIKVFKDADHILWTKKLEQQPDGSYNIQIVSSEYWLHDLPFQGEFETAFELKEVLEEKED